MSPDYSQYREHPSLPKVHKKGCIHCQKTLLLRAPECVVA